MDVPDSLPAVHDALLFQKAGEFSDIGGTGPRTDSDFPSVFLIHQKRNCSRQSAEKTAFCLEQLLLSDSINLRETRLFIYRSG